MFNPCVWTYNVGPHSKPHCQHYEHIVYGGEHPKCEKNLNLETSFVFRASLILLVEDFSTRMW